MRKSNLLRIFAYLTLFCVSGAVPILAQPEAREPASASGNPPPDARFKADVLLVLAHPDDETAIGSRLAEMVFDQDKKIAALYTNRGNGGGNSIGNEQSSAMGLMREIEAREALGRFGIRNVWFLDGSDTPGQDVFRSLNGVGHGTALEQVVRIIRLTRPDVLITWLPHYAIGENHGDHQAAGVIAVEAFDLAGDPTVFPVQVLPPRERSDIDNINEGLHPWQPKKLYFFSDASHPLPAPGPDFDITGNSPSRISPYYRLAAELHLSHLTQSEVSRIAADALESGDFGKFIEWLRPFRLIFGKALVACNPSGPVFEGVPEGRIPFSRPPGYREETRAAGLSFEFGGVFSFYRDFRKAHGIESAGIATFPEVGIARGDYLHVPLLIHNHTPGRLLAAVRSILPADWEEYAGPGLYSLEPGETRPVQCALKAPWDESVSLPELKWKAVCGDEEIGTLVLKVRLSEWTLPQ
ncbi:PIG-L family deacetylase [bacterium]|nr:PIG-L family deacetylase [bacterium]